ncbi:hypothetical protein [Salinilacihabitans rarus]|uniref:hypothetical protein n=1 Tax=Salinilacihabitans rarus TaxID=2961596 RepID=UPI0020C92261|nr:hypothetical protein [Salinilacihabitans rarus]
MSRAYCRECGWEARAGEDGTGTDLDRAMIEHHVETGHAPIERTGAGRDAPRRVRPRTRSIVGLLEDG